MTSASLSFPESAAPGRCVQKGQLESELNALVATISSLENGLKEPKTVRDLVHPESLRFALQLWAERKDALQAEYENHRLAHGC
jgi:hypothetical protein